MPLKFFEVFEVLKYIGVGFESLQLRVGVQSHLREIFQNGRVEEPQQVDLSTGHTTAPDLSTGQEACQELIHRLCTGRGVGMIFAC